MASLTRSTASLGVLLAVYVLLLTKQIHANDVEGTLMPLEPAEPGMAQPSSAKQDTHARNAAVTSSHPRILQLRCCLLT